MNTKGLFSSASQHWSTPKELYDALNKEFDFNDDPCPLSENGIDGLLREWGTRTYCNPPYGRNIGKWINKGYNESQQGKLVVMLIPCRTDTKWFHEYVLKGEIRLIRGRLKFGDSKNSAPFPSAIVVFDGRSVKSY